MFDNPIERFPKPPTTHNTASSRTLSDTYAFLEAVAHRLTVFTIAPAPEVAGSPGSVWLGQEELLVMASTEYLSSLYQPVGGLFKDEHQVALASAIPVSIRSNCKTSSWDG